jgi:hypothetical protein
MFNIYELVPKSIYEAEGEAAWRYIDPEAKQMLFNIRKWIGKPCTVNDYHWNGKAEWRGMRTPGKTVELGSPNSLHKADPDAGIFCRAFDVIIPGTDYEDLRMRIIAQKNDPLLKLINRMEMDISWLHIDRGKPPAGHERIYLFRA